MNPENLPNSESEQYDPNLDAQDEEVVSGGNNRLTYALIGVIIVLVLCYVALPKGGGEGLSSVTPTFMLDDAAVTATKPTAADSLAAGLKAAPAPAPVLDNLKETNKAPAATGTAVAAPKPASTSAPAPTTGIQTLAPVVSSSAAEVEPAPAPAPAPAAPTVAAESASAPTTVTMSGKIEDENGRPMIGATVLLKGSSKATSTDANGNYTLEVPSGSDNTLIYGYGGYDDEIVRSRGSQPVNVTLTPRAKSGRRRR